MSSEEAQVESMLKAATAAPVEVHAVNQRVLMPRFGFLSYQEAFRRLPEYEQAKADFAALKQKYDDEAARSEQEFQQKFAEFLQGQKDFPASIMQKRQLELQDLMEKSISFREQSRKLLAEAEAQMQQTARLRLDDAIRAVGARLGLLFIINTDNNACPYLHPDAGIDVTDLVEQELTK